VFPPFRASLIFASKAESINGSGVTYSALLTNIRIKQRTFKNVNNCLYTKIYPYFETNGGKSFNLHLNVVHFVNTSDS